MIHTVYTLTVTLSMLVVPFYSFPLLIDTEIIYVFATSKQKWKNGQFDFLQNVTTRKLLLKELYRLCLKVIVFFTISFLNANQCAILIL